MIGNPRGPESRIEPGTNTERWWDAKILQDTVREALHTSPESFLKTVSYVDKQPLDYWINEVRSSTWAVAQRDGEVVGIAAAKRPDPEKDTEDPATTRYIESVWIDPNLRGNRLSERLIRYLLEAEYRKNQHIKQFLLWVFPTNSHAIKVYKRMGFVPTSETNSVQMSTEIGGSKTEIKYRLDFDPEVYAAVPLAVNEAARRQDERQYGVTYRILGGKDSM